MKSLLILRHAKSSWSHPNLADHDRPLNKRGKRDAPRMGKLLRQEELTPDLIISSTAERAIATAEEAAQESGYEADELKVTRYFYHAAPEMYVTVLQELLASLNRVMVVGHNPGMAELVEDLTGETVRMPTAALAHVALPIDAWDQLRLDTAGKLVSYWEPRSLP